MNKDSVSTTKWKRSCLTGAMTGEEWNPTLWWWSRETTEEISTIILLSLSLFLSLYPYLPISPLFNQLLGLLSAKSTWFQSREPGWFWAHSKKEKNRIDSESKHRSTSTPPIKTTLLIVTVWAFNTKTKQMHTLWIYIYMKKWKNTYAHWAICMKMFIAV